MGAPKIEEINHNELIELLKSCSIFDGADPNALAFAAGSCELLIFRSGESIILENEPNTCVHFIARGDVEIATYLAAEKRVQRLLLLGQGSHFGEFSALTRSARSGSAYAFTDCVILRMSGGAFSTLIENHSGVAINLLGHLARISQAGLSSYEFIPFYADSPVAMSQQILQVFPQALWKKFGAIPLSLKAGVLSVAVRDPHQAAFYTHLAMSFPKLEISVSTLGEREFQALNEVASGLVNQTPVLPSKAAAPPIDTLASLRESILFQGFSAENLEQWMTGFKHVAVKAGTVILKVGQTLEESYLILRGSVQMSRQVRSTNATAPVILLEVGDSFGDEQILLDVASPCLARAIEDTELLAIPKEITNQLLDNPNFVIALTRAFAVRLQMLGHVSGLNFVSPDSKFDFTAVASLFSMALIDQEKVIPLQIVKGELTIGMVSPERSGTLLKIDRYLSDYRVRIAGLTEEQFRSYRLALKTIIDSSQSTAAAKAEGSTERLDVVKWVDSILAQGMRSGASDIHFEPGPTGLTTRFRIDGVLREFGRKLPSESVTQAVSRLKILASMDISIQHVPQDGHLETIAESIKIMARANSLPIKQGEKIVLRLIRERNSVVPLEVIAPDRRIVSFLKAVAERRQGLFLVTGPTGSGKTTTLYSLLKLINQVDVNVISIEDPIEMELRGVNQVEINNKRGLEFAQALKSVLRQDPDVVMVGEIRDATSAKIVFDAAMTGCLVLSTLHSGTSLEAVPRLKDLGVSLSQIAEGLVGVITQRLVRTVCKHCVKDHPLNESEQEMFSRVPRLEVPAVIKRGDGCQACGLTGYQGRLPVFEMWGSHRAMSDQIRAGVSTAELEEAARLNGYESLFEFALRLVQSGATTPEEVRRVLSGTGSLF